MIWADRVALVWLPLVVLYWCAISMGSPVGIGTTVSAGFVVVAALAVLPWLILRGLDFIVAGRVRWVSSAKSAKAASPRHSTP